MSAQGVVNAALRKRIERLESLVKRALAASAAASLSFAGPVVANEAAAAAFPLSDVPNGRAQVFVLSHRSIWTKRNGVPGVQGVPPLSPHEVIATTAGTAGVLCRTDYSDPALRVGINDIWIDPANPAANDENNGLTAGAPLKTGYELFRRWGWGGSQPIVGPNMATSPDGFTNIHVVSDVTSPDSLPIRITLAMNAGLRVRGETITVIHTGTLTDAVTAMNRAAPLGGTRLTVRDNTLASWAAFEVQNRRVRMINGPATGGTFQPQTDSLATPGQVQCSACQTTNEPGFSQQPTNVTPAVGNTYHVEKLTVVNFGTIELDQELNPNFGGFNAFVNIIDCNLPQTGGEAWSPKVTSGAWLNIFLNFYQCTIDRGVDLSEAGAAQFVACYYSNGVNNYGNNEASIQGGGANVFIQNTIAFWLWGGLGAVNAAFDSDFVSNGYAISLGQGGSGRNFAVWSVAAGGFANAGGHGVLIGFNGTFGGMRGNANFSGTLWGNGNAGRGVLVGANCGGAGAAQNITGTGGDLKLADSTVGWWWNAVTAVYNPIGAGIALTWAAIAAAKGVAGFGGGAHEPDKNSHWSALETTT